MNPQSSGDELIVLKVGGALASRTGALDRVCAEIARVGKQRRIVVVPGGGPWADSVRELDSRLPLSQHSAHWMAVLAMDQYAQLLVERIPGSVLVDELGAVQGTARACRVVVLAPSRWMRSSDLLPHSWDVTSDSIAAVVAGALDAARLILIKPEPAAGNLVDPFFETALPLGLPWAALGYDQIEELDRQISG